MSTSPPPVTTSPPPVSTNPPTGSVTLNWMPPTENTNGTPLTDLAGYDIHYGSMSEDYAQTISISNPGIATYVVDNLPSGVYYFTVTSVNTAGTESQLSSEVKATVN
ncbi:MAG: fibronectin type III domain-containing protein [Steroidobacteraceae bacterium]